MAISICYLGSESAPFSPALCFTIVNACSPLLCFFFRNIHTFCLWQNDILTAMYTCLHIPADWHFKDAENEIFGLAIIYVFYLFCLFVDIRALWLSLFHNFDICTSQEVDSKEKYFIPQWYLLRHGCSKLLIELPCSSKGKNSNVIRISELTAWLSLQRRFWNG